MPPVWQAGDKSVNEKQDVVIRKLTPEEQQMALGALERAWHRATELMGDEKPIAPCLRRRSCCGRRTCNATVSLNSCTPALGRLGHGCARGGAAVAPAGDGEVASRE